jgi:SAM-dependent methyltransferase
MSDPLDHVRANRAAWDVMANDYKEGGRRAWAAQEPRWGIWGVPESQLRVLPEVSGLDVIELGCGTAYFSSWLARRGARVVGIDNSAAQLANARRYQEEFGLEFPLIHGNAEQVPLGAGGFDLAISEYGASLWCDPYRWIPEAARLLRPGGRLVFLTNGTLAVLCWPEREADGPAGTILLRDYFGMHRHQWPGSPGVEFHLGYGDWIRVLRSSGFDVEDLVEVRPPEGSVTNHPDIATLEWSRRWPSEEIWKARKPRPTPISSSTKTGS